MAKGDILCPPVILSATYCISIGFAITQMQRWGLNTFHWNTFAAIVGGVCFFSISYHLGALVWRHIHGKAVIQSGKKIELKYIKVNNIILLAFIAIAIVIGVLYLKEVIRIAKANGASGTWSNYLYVYRRIASFGEENATIGLNRYIKYGYEFVRAVGYLMCYFIVNNYFVQKKINKLILVAILVCIFVSSCNANRLEFIFYPISILTMSYILSKARAGWENRSNIKLILKLSVVFGVLILVFSATSTVIGRNVQGDIFYNITIYLGGPIKLFDMFMQDKQVSLFVWGQETFGSTVNYILSKTQYSALQYSTQKEFRYYNGLSLGNVYSGLRCYVHDFGYVGLSIIMSIYGALFSWFYNGVKISLYKNKIIPYGLIFYSYVIHCVFLEFYSNYFFEKTLTTTMLKMVIIIYVSGWYFVKVRHRYNIRFRFSI